MRGLDTPPDHYTGIVPYILLLDAGIKLDNRE